MFEYDEKTLEFNVLVSNNDLQHLKEKLRSPKKSCDWEPNSQNTACL